MLDVIVIGAGPGGYVAAIRAAQNGLKTLIIDKRETLGGTCLNVGCIPSKTLLHDSEKGDELGKMMKRKEEVVAQLTGGVKQLMDKNKIEVVHGTAKIIDPTHVEVDGTSYETKNIVIATGSEPIELPFMPFDEKKVLSSTGALSLKKVPKKMIVIGGGVIGVEMASIYSRMGSEVTIIEMQGTLCPGTDKAITDEFAKILKKQGITIHLSTKVESYEKGVLNTSAGEFKGDVILVAVGRRAVDKVKVDAHFRTEHSNVYAIGDAIDGPMLAHKASEEGIAVANIIAGKPFHINYVAIPNVVYTHPEIATVGLTEEEAKAHFQVKVGKARLSSNPRALCTGETDGLVKIVADKATDRLLGLHILSANASEMIAACVMALEKRMTCSEFANVCYAHPTLSEAVKEAALAVDRRAIHS